MIFIRETLDKETSLNRSNTGIQTWSHVSEKVCAANACAYGTVSSVAMHHADTSSHSYDNHTPIPIPSAFSGFNPKTLSPSVPERLQRRTGHGSFISIHVGDEDHNVGEVDLAMSLRGTTDNHGWRQALCIIRQNMEPNHGTSLPMECLSWSYI